MKMSQRVFHFAADGFQVTEYVQRTLKQMCEKKKKNKRKEKKSREKV